MIFNIPMLSTLTLTSSLILSCAYASDRHDNQERGKHKKQEDGMNRILREKIKNHKPKYFEIKTSKKPTTLTTIACGDVITQSITVANDLNCPNIFGFALKISGNNIVINGNGHKISAPNAAAGIYIEGDNNSVSKFNVQDISQGYGILAYNTQAIKILANNFSHNMIGIMIYADSTEIIPTIINNKAIRNSFAAIRTYSDNPGSITDPIIRKNDFSSTGEFAIYLKTERFKISGDEGNEIGKSKNGYYLKDGDFKISNISLTNQLIYKRHFFIDSARTAIFNNVDVSTFAPLTFSQERMGIDLYRVEKFKLNKVKAKNHDVGLKLETETGASSEGSVYDCLFENQSFAGVYIVSYDDTHYGTIRFSNTNFNLLDGVGKIIVEQNTVATIIQDITKRQKTSHDNEDTGDCDNDDDEKESEREQEHESDDDCDYY